MLQLQKPVFKSLSFAVSEISKLISPGHTSFTEIAIKYVPVVTVTTLQF